MMCCEQLICNQPALPAIDAVNLIELRHIGMMRCEQLICNQLALPAIDAVNLIELRHINMMCKTHSNDSTGNRTRVTAVKGRCLDRLTMEPHALTTSMMTAFNVSILFLNMQAFFENNYFLS